MLWWVVDNANAVILVLGLVLLVLAVVYWKTRRRNVGIATVVTFVLLVVVVVLSLVIVTDRKKLTADVRTLIDEVNDDKLDLVVQHFEDQVDVDVPGKKLTADRQVLKVAARKQLDQIGAQPFSLSNVEVEELERPRAVVTFRVRPKDGVPVADCRAVYVLGGGGNWRIKSLKVELGKGP
jgi:hypothetical protein